MMSKIISCVKILEMIDPADPDRICHLGDGVYQAVWSDVVTPQEVVEDREVIRQTNGIDIADECPRLPQFQGWSGMNFTIRS